MSCSSPPFGQPCFSVEQGYHARREKHRGQKSTVRYHFLRGERKVSGAKRTPGSRPRDLPRWKSGREPKETTRSQSKESSLARATAWVLFSAASFSRRLPTCFLTVVSETTRRLAIS